MMLSYNPHPSPRAVIGQIICPKIHLNVVVERLKKKRITRLPSNYNPLELSPPNKHLGRRRDMVIKAHQT